MGGMESKTLEIEDLIDLLRDARDECVSQQRDTSKLLARCLAEMNVTRKSLKDENAKLCELCDRMETCYTYAGRCDACPMMVYGFESEPYCGNKEEIEHLKRELGIGEVR